jgi:hypothetical protein
MYPCSHTRRLTCGIQGYEAAQRAVALDPSSSACHKWMAIMISDIGDLEGLKNKLLKSYTMKVCQASCWALQLEYLLTRG